MPINYIFWGIYLLSLAFGFWFNYQPTDISWPRRAGSFGVIWLLVGILGYQVFGSAVK